MISKDKAVELLTFAMPRSYTPEAISNISDQYLSKIEGRVTDIKTSGANIDFATQFGEATKKDGGIIKVTTETYYNTYDSDVESLDDKAKNWFVDFGSSNHSYRDNSQYPISNILEVRLYDKEH